MRRIGTVTVLAGALVLFAGAGASAAEKDVEKIPFCQYCGMDRAQFATTRMLVEYENGTTIGTCSVHCAAVDLAQSFGKAIKAIRVADQRTGKLVDAEKAAWVIGSSLPGVMAARSRVAFAQQADAEALRKDKGGELANFDAAITSAYCDMWSDTQGIRSRRAAAAKGGGAR